MKHNTSGEITLNGEKYNFDNGKGYIESDSGYSFPKNYSWVQGKYHLKVTVNRQNTHNLPAPKSGLMNRIIKESESCPAEFVFTENSKTVFSGESTHASYEYEMEPS